MNQIYSNYVCDFVTLAQACAAVPKGTGPRQFTHMVDQVPFKQKLRDDQLMPQEPRRRLNAARDAPTK